MTLSLAIGHRVSRFSSDNHRAIWSRRLEDDIWSPIFLSELFHAATLSKLMLFPVILEMGKRCFVLALSPTSPPVLPAPAAACISSLSAKRALTVKRIDCRKDPSFSGTPLPVGMHTPCAERSRGGGCAEHAGEQPTASHIKEQSRPNAASAAPTNPGHAVSTQHGLRDIFGADIPLCPSFQAGLCEN